MKSLSLVDSNKINSLNIIDIHSNLLIEDAQSIPDVISKLSDEKLLALIDISSWQKDRFDVFNFSTWLKVIFSLPPYEALTQVKRLDSSELVMFIQNIIDIKWYDTDELYDGDYKITHDNAFILFPKDKDMFDLCVHLIDLCYLEDMAFGRKLCIDAMSFIYSTLEEDTYRIRNSRLADEGIPTYLESLELFYFEKPSKILKDISKILIEKKKRYKPEKTYPVSEFAVVTKEYWSEFINLTSEEVEWLEIELSSLLTASIVMNNAVDKDEAFIKEIVDRSKSYFRLGMELIRDELGVSDILKYVSLKYVFRLGFSLLVDLKKNATNLSNIFKTLDKEILLTADDDEFIKNLTAPIPVFKKRIDAPLEEFKTLEKVKEARKRISEIANLVSSH